MITKKNNSTVCAGRSFALSRPAFPTIPFLLRGIVIALWVLPPNVYAQSQSTPVVIEKNGSNGRNAGGFPLYRGSKAGGKSADISYTLNAGKTIHTPAANGAVQIVSRGGKGGNGHDGVVADSAGSMGGDTGAILLNVLGNVTNHSMLSGAHGISVSATAGQAGTRRRGGSGGGSAGPISLNVNNSQISTASRTAAAIQVQSQGGQGNSGFEAVGIRWSGSNGGQGGAVTANFSGVIDSAGRGIAVSSSGGKGGSISGGVIQTISSHGGTGGRAGNIQSTISGRNNGQSSSITTTANEGHALHLRSQGGDGGEINGTSWFNGADGGSGGNGGHVSATLSNVRIQTSGDNAGAVVVESNGGKGFWGGGSALAKGGKAGSGGDGGMVTVRLEENTHIRTQGNDAIAVQAVSRGGGGSNGGKGGFIYSPGGDGSSGGVGGEVHLLSSAQIETLGKDSYGVYAASLGGAAGDGGKGSGIVGVGGHGGANSRSSKVELKQSSVGSVVTKGEASHGLFAESIGGDGGTYNSSLKAVMGGDSQSNSPNAHGGTLSVVNLGHVRVEGKAAKGILAQSVGGGGGNGGSSVGLIAIGGDGHSSGNGSTVLVENRGVVSTKGSQGYGIHAQSIGGGGGSASTTLALGVGVNIAIGGKGATAGNGGNVNVLLGDSSLITTEGADANAVVAQSIGGGGGDGGETIALGFLDVFTKSLGGSGGAAGNGGRVQVDTNGQIKTRGEGAAGVLAQSIGGGGGIGGNSTSAGITLVSIGLGRSGGAGGRGGSVSFTNKAQIETDGADAYGALLQSIGGGGGAGGQAIGIAISALPQYSGSAAIAVGGAGGDGNSGGNVDATNVNSIITSGHGSKVLVAQSIGGGGGAAGSANTFSFSASPGIAVSLAISVGGSGGAGGDGGDVTVNNKGGLQSTGDHATGVLAQSVGGGGGVGGGAVARAVAYGSKSFSGALSIGGKGGTGGNGGEVSVHQQGIVNTAGNAAIGVLAQSIGGGGGNGGLTHGDTRADTANIAIVLGRKGGDGGDGGKVDATQSDGSLIQTQGIASNALVLQSIGGGGGVGSAIGDSTMPPWPEPAPIPGGGGYKYEGYSGSLILALGGSGGQGGKADEVTATLSGNIVTHGRQSHGLVAQSIGGGGGSSGTSSSSAPGGDLSLSLNIGGSGGTGGTGGAVTLELLGNVRTNGLDSIGVLAQSIGGGGGNASTTEAGQSAGKVGVNVAIGGGGGDGAQGGAVTVTQKGTVRSQMGDALVAQSIGGGGGVAGTVHAGLESDEFNNLIEGELPEKGGAFSLAIGGRGGEGSDGGAVRVEQRGVILAGGEARAGATLQSIGGGGGMGGMASTYYQTSIIAPSAKLQVSMAVGGNGGAGGDGGSVTWRQGEEATTTATGTLGDAVRLQSIGGGGGVAGGVAVGAKISDDGTKVRVDAALINLNGRAGVGGKGGTVKATNEQNSALYTNGEGGIGLVAQSIGGGGGLVQAVYKQTITETTINVGGGKGNGGLVDITQSGNIYTTGQSAHGILAQSIGGGGGATRVIGANNTKAVFNAAVAGKGDGGRVEVLLGDTAMISTTGKGAYGVLAQSIGGGGGYINTGTTSAPTAGTLTQTHAGSGNGGDVHVQAKGVVHTVGDNATAIFAQSVGGGGGMVNGVVGKAGEKGQGNAGNVTVQVGGTVSASGNNASAIVAQSVGSKAGVITVKVLENASVQGGLGDAEAIRLMDGIGNTVSIAKGATVSALSNVAIRSVGSRAHISNHGNLYGSLLLAESSSLDNYGSVYAGEQLQLHGGAVKNNGLFYIGTAERNAVTRLEGSYTQTVAGTYAPKVDFLGQTSDMLQVAKTANLSGVLAVQGVNHLPGEHQFNVLHATEGLMVDKDFSSKGNAVFDYPLQYKGNTLTVGLEADFTRHNAVMSEEQVELSQYLGRKWEAAAEQVAANNAQKSATPQLRTAMLSAAPTVGSGVEQPGQAYVDVFDTLALTDNVQAYAQVLDQIANDAMQAPVAILPLANRMFLNRTMSCPSTDITNMQSQEKSCFWGDIQGNWLDRSAHHDDSGFSYDSVRYIIGGQHPLGNGWVAGGGVSYEHAKGKAKNVALRSSGDNFSGMAFVRKIDGPWSYAGALSAGYGSYDTDRSIVTSEGVIKPSADWDAHFVSLRLQAAYTHLMDGFYIKPAIDVDVMYQHVPSYAEKGGGAFNLAFEGTSELRAMISPSVELGARIEQESYVLRPYLGLGVNWMPNNDWQTDAYLKQDKSGDRFRLSQSLPSVFGEYRVGMDIDTGKDVVLRAEWRQRLGDRYNDRSAQLQLGVKF